MEPAETLELQCALAWPPVTGERLGCWWLRAAAGFTGRANTALAIGDPGLPIADALDRVCDFAHSHGLEPAVQVIQGGHLERALDDLGWVPNVAHAAGHEVSVLVGPLGTPDGTARMLDAPTPEWWELCAGTAEPSEAQRHVLTTAPAVGYGVAETGTETVGAVRGAVVDDVLHVSRLAVRPAYRRKGVAVDLMGAVGAWGAALGATRCALQVSVTNAPALALYDRLGFTEHHRYRYWVPATGSCEDRSS
ncbi:GNAT family N-acetyltransferase [Amycolatopsis magusensis]|uniref:Ribosomal protein S18 acetylase RimI-like enzyme n=1 Tax=Amycolatopsis magusensis TaxID=882444 RepID=A0ABS4PMX9_9PSEU|nr:GNAT family N-acetyltransferase [Amycolatopsis magusensis]MBP2180769.1 ribosomal protein S18 acetylase RimI-like enzyme [Amycolatopsis magusensis]